MFWSEIDWESKILLLHWKNIDKSCLDDKYCLHDMDKQLRYSCHYWSSLTQFSPAPAVTGHSLSTSSLPPHHLLLSSRPTHNSAQTRLTPETEYLTPSTESDSNSTQVFFSQHLPNLNKTFRHVTKMIFMKLNSALEIKSEIAWYDLNTSFIDT